MQTISHFLKPIGGAQAQPLRPDAALFALPEAVPIGLAGNLVVHVRPNGTADADPADLAGLEISTWRFVMAADWDPTTPPAFLCTDISHAAGSGIWTIQLAGSRTREMLLAIGRLGVATMGFELAGIAAGDTWASPSYLLQWKGPVVSRRDSGSTPWPAPDDPDTGGVPVHKSNHATGGSDSLAPSDIGAAAAQHSHAQADVTGLADALAGKAAAQHTHAQADVTGLADALAGKAAAQHTHAQADVTGLADALDGKASTADATLTAVFSSWTCVPATYQGYTITVFDYVESNSWDLKAGNATIGSVNKSGDEDTRIVFRAGADWYGDVDLIATRIKSYQLGSQSDKPLAPAWDYALRSELGTAASKNVSASGNASPTQVVMGNDTRLTDARKPMTHTHEASQIHDGARDVSAQYALDTLFLSKANATALAAAFAKPKTYAVGDLATYNGLLYRCKSAYTATALSIEPETDTTHWEAAVVAVLLDGKLDKSGGTITGEIYMGAESGISLPASRLHQKLPITSAEDDTVYIKPTAKTANSSLASLKDIASGYSESAAYVVGQICVKNDELVKCTTAGTGGAAVFESATVEDVLALLRAAIAAKYTKPAGGIPAADLAAGVIPSLASYVQKSQTAGLLKNDGTVDTNTYLTAHQELRYQLVTKTPTVSGTTASATLEDRAVNSVAVASSITTLNLAFPAAAANGYGRDFFIRVVVEGTSIATVNFMDGVVDADVEIGGDDVSSDWNKAGTHLVLFTEIAPGKWLASKRFEEAAP